MNKKLFHLIGIQFFASTLEAAMKYIQEPDVLEQTLMYNTVTSDLVDDSAIFDGVKYVKYQAIQFGALTPGTYSFASGYTEMDVHTTWKTMELTQDIGNSLSIERIEDEEAMGNGIVRFANRYHQRIFGPAVDRYRLNKLATTKNAHAKLLDLTAENIIGEILHAKARFEDARISTNALILYITSGVKEVAKNAAIAKGYFSIGNWNGNLEAEVEMIDGIKLVPAPADLFPTDVQAILVNKNASPAFNKFEETTIFDQIPGHGKRKLQADIGLYHDLLVYDELCRGIYVFKKTAATKYTVTYDKGDDAATGTPPTQAETAPDGEFVLKANSFTLANKTFVGWSDGTHLYPAGYNYVMPGNNVTLKAIWN